MDASKSEAKSEAKSGAKSEAEVDAGETQAEARARGGAARGLTPKLLARQAPDQSGSGKPAPAHLKVAFFQLAYALRNPQ